MLTVVSKNTYYFAIIRNDTDCGFQVCIPPVDPSKLELYIIKNTKKNIENINTQQQCKNSQDVIAFIENVIMCDITQRQRCVDVYTMLTNDFNNISFEIVKNNNTISIKKLQSTNGYYIYFDLQSFAKIGTIKNDEYHNTNSTSVSDYSSLVNSLTNLVSQNYHDVIKYYNIIDSKYIGCDMSDYNMNQYNDTNNSTNSSVCGDDSTDPI